MKAQQPVQVDVALGHEQGSWSTAETVLPIQGKPTEKGPACDEDIASVESEEVATPDGQSDGSMTAAEKTPTVQTPTEQTPREGTLTTETTMTEEEAPAPEQVKEVGTETKATASKEKADVIPEKVAQKIDKVANIIEQELDELSEEQLENLTPTLRRQIEILRKMTKDYAHQEEEEEEEGEEGEADGETEKSAEDAADDDDEGYKEEGSPVVAEVRKYTMEDWKKVKTMETYPLIMAYYRGLPQNTSHPHGHLNKGAISSSKERQERPQRVKIISSLMLDEIEDITDVLIPTYSPWVLAPPYKLFLKHRSKMLEREEQLKKELDEINKTIETGAGTKTPTVILTEQPSSTEEDDKSATTAANGAATEKKTEPEPAAISKPPVILAAAVDPVKKRKELTWRHSQLSVLNRFVETELGSYLDLQERIAAGTLEKIAYEDLWLLFQPGDMVFLPTQGHDQLCRVFSFTGGLQRKRAPNSRESATTTSYRDDGDIIFTGSGRGTWTPVKLDLYRMEFNGRMVGPKGGSKYIRHYAGELKVTDLPVYPLRFHKDGEAALLARLMARGQKYITSYGHKSYRGITTPTSETTSPEEVNGEIFVDLKEFYRHNSHEKPELGILQRTLPEEAEAEEPAGDSSWLFCDHEVDQQSTEQFMLQFHDELEVVELEMYQKGKMTSIALFPFSIPAYAFRTRYHIHVNIDIVAEIDKSDRVKDGGFDDLVIPDSHRELLIALVKNKVQDPPASRLGADVVGGETETPSQIDIVRGKGKGLIILLHGPPGSGKTSTAETLAAYTRRPLYPITCGDLGTGPIEVERTLTEHTERAQRWGCILLLDEADVFLTRRDWRDTTHNALVSVFLRQLEYYSGILFLTTNRVGVIDEAFKSRIHVSLAYPTIRLQETIDIWKGILRRIERDNRAAAGVTTGIAAIEVRFKADNLLAFARTHYRQHERTGTTWNGRQIRNAFQLAVALGHYERDKKLVEAGLTSEQALATGEKKWRSIRLTTDSFRSISRTARDFEDYLLAVRGSDSEIARNMYLRHDDQADQGGVGVGMMDVGSGSGGNAWARKDYGRQSSLLSPSRNQGPPAAVSSASGRRSPSASRSPAGARKGKGEETVDKKRDEDDDNDDDELLDEFSSEDDD